jgi:uncharacterized protein (DUF433 family)
MLDTEAEKAEKIPLEKDAHGAIRVGGTRVTLDVVIEAYDQGATPEQTVQKFGELRLDDIYAVLTYYLRHTEDVRAYLAERAKESDRLRDQVVATAPSPLSRERLLRQKQAREGDAK